MLQVGVCGLETAPLDEGRHSQAVGGPRWGIDLWLEGAELGQGGRQAQIGSLWFRA